MTEGRVTGDEAVLLGKMRIRGGLTLGRRFGELFPARGEPRWKRVIPEAGSGLGGSAERDAAQSLDDGRAA